MSKPTDWTPRQRIEAEYRRRINQLIDRFLEVPDSATLGEILESLVNFENAWRYLQRTPDDLARRMVTQVRVANARSWREAATKGSHGREIYEALRRELKGNVGSRVAELVAENAKLISSIPATVREHINREIADMQQQGLRSETIAKHLRKSIPQLSRSRAALIARTETSKAAESITRARSEDMGIMSYVWETSQDQRVRKSHRLLQGVIVFWNDAPSPETLAHEHSNLGHYHAGGAPNCRCTALPLMNYSDVNWPHRIYVHGTIRSMRLIDFRNLTERRSIAA